MAASPSVWNVLIICVLLVAQHVGLSTSTLGGDVLSIARANVAVITDFGTTVFAGGRDGSGATARTDIYYDVGSPQMWQPTQSLTQARTDSAIAYYFTTVFIGGGLVTSTSTCSNVMDQFDTTTFTFGTSRALSVARRDLAAATSLTRIKCFLMEEEIVKELTELHRAESICTYHPLGALTVCQWPGMLWVALVLECMQYLLEERHL